MAQDGKDITLATILEHIQGLRDDVTGRLGHIEQQMDRMVTRMDRMEQNLTNQIDAIDKRLDEIEIELLPKRVAKLEEAVGMAA